MVIKLIERSHEIGRGVAYSTHNIGHLLNVSAGNMSAFPDDPGHLLRWLNYNYTELAPFLPYDLNVSSFIPRQIFGLYIQSILEEAEATASSNVRLERISDEVVGIEPEAKKAKVTLASKKTFAADRVVLAIGNSPATPPALDNHQMSYLRNAWSADAVTDLDPDASVLLIGTGLTMVDMLVSLKASNHRGKIYAVSRRGLFPLTHRATPPYPPFLTPATAPKTVRGLVRQLRQEVQTAQAQGYDWRAVVDSLRPITQQLWGQLPPSEQQKFLRRLTPYWDVHRHRIAPEIGVIVQSFLDSGQLTVTAARIQDYQATADGVKVTIKRRKSQTQEVLTVDRGDQLVEIQIAIPPEPSPEELELYQAIRNLEQYNPRQKFLS
ncbi:MAG: FAD/NAD(P)-binding protein [Snowella sp.]